MPETIATIIAVSTEAMILFHSNDDIDDPPTLSGRQTIEIPPAAQPEISRFRRSDEPGILSLLTSAESIMTRAAPENPIIVIPARLAATRLPGKPLADIAGT